MDELDVSRVILRYAYGVDERDWETVRACFDPEGHMDGIFGSASTRDYLPGLIDRVEQFGKTMHFVANQWCEVEGDTARTRTYGIAHHFADDQGTVERLVAGVRYDDELSRLDDGSWRITRRVTRTLWTRQDERGVR